MPYKDHSVKLAKGREYFQRTRETRLAKKREYYLSHRAEQNAKSKEYYEAHKNDPNFKRVMAEYKERWRANNRERYLASTKEYNRKYLPVYYAANREALLEKKKEYQNRPEVKARLTEYKKSWYANKREELKERSRKHYKDNIEAHSSSSKQWKKANAEKVRQYNHKRSWLKRSVNIDLVFVKWEICDHVCYICGEAVSKDNISVDHVIPVSKNGLDHINNLMPVHNSCNCRKRDKLNYPVARPDLVRLANGD